MGGFRSQLEVYVHKALERHGYDKFVVNTYPKWLVNPLTSRSMQLDFYDDSRKMAIEVQGPRHQCDSHQMMRDAFKRNLCRERGVELMYVTMTSKSKDVKRVLERLKKK